jgi:KipI family sensor histidine kinase inhibitor
VNERLDVREAGDGAVLLQLARVIDPLVNARVIAIARAVRRLTLRGVRDVVPTFHSVAVHIDPLVADIGEVAAALREAAMTPPPVTTGQRHQLPVAYGGEDGPDLELVATQAGLTIAEVIRRHSDVPYRVYMLGFQPGFAYLGLVDPILAIPRRATPRVRVPAGSVGIAGRQTAVYPTASPGGWQIVGRALEPVIDTRGETPRFAPGDTVTFVAAHGASISPPDSEIPAPAGAGRVTVVSPGLFTTIQDARGWGRQDLGLPVTGPMDPVSHALANVAVGNEAEAGALEATIVGPELRMEQSATLAVAGADLSATLDGVIVPLQTPVTARDGSVLRFGPRRRGARAYVAFAGGVHIGRRWPVTPLVAGDVVALDASSSREPHSVAGVRELSNGGARLRVLRGPQDDQLPPECLNTLLRSRLTISPQSNRIGYRLAGASLPSTAGEMISDATFFGGIQVPPSGEAILLMADRQTTGGYPQIATVITADLPIAGQLAPGDWVEFIECTRREAVAALAAQRAMIRHAG